MKRYVLFLVVLLFACASEKQPGGAIGSTGGTAPGHRKSGGEVQPVTLQPPVAVQAQQVVPPPAPAGAQQPSRSDQGGLPPRKNIHNVEED